MGVFSRIGKGWNMAFLSLKVIRRNKQLILFPIISGLALVAILASFVGVAILNYGMELDLVIENSETLDYVIAFLFYLVSYFIVVFFNIGLVHCTRVYLQGGEPSFSDGVRFAATRIPTILGWSVLAATVGLILKAIQENSGTVGQIISSIIGVVWSIVTFFVVPVLAYEDLGPVEALKRSTGIMKNKWGESIGASFSFGAVTFVGMLIIALPIGLIAGSVNVFFGLAVGVLVAFLIHAIVSSAEMVFIASVYHKMVADQPVEYLNSEVIDDLFIEKKKKGLF
ncbi:MAG: hypothetical protein JJ975_04125 [Bacteroidia bacterium]|nr:hypothetical protein [Bacteroidia bacterium]